jgi:hypothetical protein
VYILQFVYCWVLQILPNRSQRCCRCVSFFSCWIPESIQATPERKLGYYIFRLSSCLFALIATRLC